MNFKKITSIFLMLAIFVSLFSFVAFASSPSYEMSYENISNPGQPIVIGNKFYAVITLKNFTVLNSAGLGLKYTPSVVQLVKAADNTVPTTFGLAANSQISSNANVKYLNVNIGMDTAAQAFESVAAGNTINTTTGYVTYGCSSATLDDDSLFTPYTFTADQITNGIVLVKLRFIALTSGNAGFAYQGGTTGNDSKFETTKANFINAAGTSITPLTIPSAGYAVTYNLDGGTGGNATGYTGSTFQALPTVAPTKDRYTFAGWKINGSDVTVGGTISAATEIKATWTAIPVTELPVVTGEVTKVASETVTFIDAVTKAPVTQAKPVVTIPCKVPASITAADITNNVEFGISLGGVRFPAKTNANTFTTLDGNGGKYIIKLVDPTGKLAGKTFKAFNYFGADKSTEVDVTISAN